jgi:hypothetical protein
MQRDQESIRDYHSLEIVDAWCRAGGTLEDLHGTLAFWTKCEALAWQRVGATLFWSYFAEAAEELMAEAKVALRADRVEELAQVWWPGGVPGRS